MAHPFRESVLFAWMVSGFIATHKLQQRRSRTENAFEFLPCECGAVSVSQQIGTLALDVHDIFWIICSHDLVLVEIKDLWNLVVIPNDETSDFRCFRLCKNYRRGVVVVMEWRKDGKVLLVTKHCRVQVRGIQSASDGNGPLSTVQKILCIQR